MAAAKHILVVGAGVIGSVCAQRFAQAGHRVTVCARGERLEQLRAQGVQLRHLTVGTVERASVEVGASPDLGARWDAIMVAVRADQLDATLASLASAQTSCLAVIGNNLGDSRARALTVGASRLVYGFAAFGGVRLPSGEIEYVDGRTPRRSALRNAREMVVGAPSEAASEAVRELGALLGEASVPVRTSADIVGWLQCHAALVLPIAAAIRATAGSQERLCRTRDALVLGVRAVRELLRCLRALGVPTQPAGLDTLLRLPEPILVSLVSRNLASPSARIAIFGHATSAGGWEELSFLGRTLDVRVRGTSLSRPAWTRLVQYFFPDGPPVLADGARELWLHPF